MFEPGQVVGQYRLERTLHRGTSTVFAATDLSTGQAVAVKVLADGFATDPSRREQFVAETERAKGLPAHDHIARVRAWGDAGGSLFLVSDLVEGLGLAEVLRRQLALGPMPTARAFALLDQVADAIDFGHRNGLLYLSFESSDVLVRATGQNDEAIVVDFGISTDDRSLRGRSGFSGAANYVAPEQISGSEPANRRTDVYAFACLAFEMLGGRPPYGAAPNETARIAAHLRAPIPSLHSLRPDLPEAIDAVFAKALAKQRDARQQRCADVVKDLRTSLSSTPAGAATLSPPSGAAVALAAPTGTQGWRQRLSPVVVAAVLALGLAGAAVAVALTRGDSEPEAVVSRTTTTTSTPPTTTVPATTTSTTSTSTTTTSTTSTTTTIPIGRFGVAVGSDVTSATGPESSFSLGVQQRADPTSIAAPGSPAMYYATWLRSIAVDPSTAVTATAEGFSVSADERVELRDFVITDGLVSDFTECAEDVCSPVSARLTMTPQCEPSPGCPSVRTQSGQFTAYQRASLTTRGTGRVLFFDMVPNGGTTRTVVGFADPAGIGRYDADLGTLVMTFPDVPIVGSRSLFVVTYDDQTTDTLLVVFDG